MFPDLPHGPKENTSEKQLDLWGCCHWGRIGVQKTRGQEESESCKLTLLSTLPDDFPVSSALVVGRPDSISGHLWLL